MGKLSKAMDLIIEGIDAQLEYDSKVRELAIELMIKTPGVDYSQVEKIAQVLVSQANEIVWK